MMSIISGESRIVALLLLGLVLVTGLCARVARLPAQSRVFPDRLTFSSSWLPLDPPSMDELWHLALTTGRGSPLGGDLYDRNKLHKAVPSLTSLQNAAPGYHIWGKLSNVLHPPLYILTLRWWREVLGDGDVAAISYSELWSLVCIVFVFAAAYSALGLSSAFWASLLCALAPVPLYIAQEIRSYSMACGLAAITLYVLVRMQKSGLTLYQLAALAFLLPALLLSHYFTVAVCAAAAIMAILGAVTSLRRKAIVVFLVCGAVTAAVWGPFFIRQMVVSLETGDIWLRSEKPMPWILLKQTVLLPLRLLVEGNYKEGWQVAVGCFLLVVPCAATVRIPALRPFAVWTLAVLGLLLTMDLVRQTRQVMLIRYASLAIPALFVIMPAWPLGLPSRVPATIRRGAVHVTGLSLLLFTLFSWKQVVRYDSPNTLAIAEIAADCMDTGDAILIKTKGGVVGYDKAILLSLSHLPGLFPRDVVLLSGPMDETLVQRLAGRFAVLISAGTDENGLSNIPGAVPVCRPLVVENALWCCRVRIPAATAPRTEKTKKQGLTKP
ncbi:MAG: glycosyltransferase family 39 protein [Kiritimatiellae bacterium]|nr:glycosyltransferase family 39 protein [Kiritimatiellia bacterium]